MGHSGVLLWSSLGHAGFLPIKSAANKVLMRDPGPWGVRDTGVHLVWCMSTGYLHFKLSGLGSCSVVGILKTIQVALQGGHQIPFKYKMSLWCLGDCLKSILLVRRNREREELMLICFLINNCFTLSWTARYTLRHTRQNNFKKMLWSQYDVTWFFVFNERKKSCISFP